MWMDLQKPALMAQELKSNLKPNFNDTLMHCPEASTTWLQIARSAFTDSFFQPCKMALVHYRACEVTGEIIRIGEVPSCCQWSSQSILWIVYISVTYWGHSTTVCALMVGIACLQLPHLLPPPTPTWHPWYYRGCKISQKLAVNTAWQSCYETVAIRLLNLYSESGVSTR